MPEPERGKKRHFLQGRLSEAACYLDGGKGHDSYRANQPDELFEFDPAGGDGELRLVRRPD
jgi:hypothetical protein